MSMGTAWRTENTVATAIRIGTAGWTLPAQDSPGAGTHLQRYAALFSAVEINSSFHRPHRASTYARWAASVPAGFSFSVKVPMEITHARKLVEVAEPLDGFLEGALALGDRLGCLLVQLPPKLAFDAAVAGDFFALLRDRHDGDVVCEPRHGSWLLAPAEDLLVKYRVGRVAADPDRPAGAGEPGGWPGVRYYRLHGSPRMYYSSYAADLPLWAERLARHREEGAPVWCIFDNTASQAAFRDAMELARLNSQA